MPKHHQTTWSRAPGHLALMMPKTIIHMDAGSSTALSCRHTDIVAWSPSSCSLPDRPERHAAQQVLAQQEREDGHRQQEQEGAGCDRCPIRDA